MDKAEQTALTPANANPWYVLMTLYGDQDGEEVDWELHEKNRALWNAWACQSMSGEERVKAAEKSKVTILELEVWPGKKDEVGRLHEVEMVRRNGEGFVYPGVPDVTARVELARVAFSHDLVLSDAVFGRDVDFSFANFGGVAWFGSTTFGGRAIAFGLGVC